jgi:hypothetical protein
VSSVIEQLRARRAQIKDNAVLELDVPGQPGLVIRYRPPHERERIGNALAVVAAGANPSEGHIDVDLVVRCTSEILQRDGKELVALAEEGGPVRFDQDDARLARLLDFPEGLPARQQAHELFMSAEQPWAIDRHYLRLVDFLQGIDHDLRARVEGESPAASAAS